MTTNWQTALDAQVDEVHARIVALRRHLHAHPEPSGEEFETTRYLRRMLEEEGFHSRPAPSGRGLAVDVDEPGAARRVAIRADIDALHIHDRKDVPYRSQRDGCMHACGHDAHSAIVFGAIVALQRAADAGALPWPVAWRAIFQPAEETSQGADEMVAAGFLDGVAAIFATHVDPSREVGRVAMRPGVLTANCDTMRFSVRGRGGHAARPHEAIDPIAAAAQLISSLYLFVPRSTDSQDSVVLTIGHVAGGQNANVIPEEVTLAGTLRTLDVRVRERTIAHITQLARGLAQTSGTQIDVSFEGGAQGVRNDPVMVRLLYEVAADLLGADKIDDVARPSMGSEDFAAYLERVPGAMFRLGCASASVSSTPLHTPTFDVDERALAIGAKILARAAVACSDPARNVEGPIV